MSHLTARGKECGLRDGHNGEHRTPEGAERRRARNREYSRRYSTTAAGMLRSIRYEAKRRGNR